MPQGTLEFTPQSDCKAEWYVSYLDNWPKDADYMHAGPQHLVITEAAGEDILLWVTPYIDFGKTPAGFAGGDVRVLYNLFVNMPTSARGTMHDNDFVSYGYLPYQFHKPDELEIVKTADKVVWRIAGNEFTIRPPYWEVKGQQAGVSYDLKMVGSAPTAINPERRWNDFPHKSKSAWFDQYTRVTGTIGYKDKTYSFQNALGVHETWFNAADRMQPFKEDLYWVFGGSPGLQFNAVAGGKYFQSGTFARAMMEGKYISFDNGLRSLSPVERWTDPRSCMTVPCKWRFNMSCADAILDLEVAATGRSYRFWPMNNGYVVDYFFLCNANGAIMYPGGRIKPLENIHVLVEWLRTIGDHI